MPAEGVCLKPLNVLRKPRLSKRAAPRFCSGRRSTRSVPSQSTKRHELPTVFPTVCRRSAIVTSWQINRLGRKIFFNSRRETEFIRSLGTITVSFKVTISYDLNTYTQVWSLDEYPLPSQKCVFNSSRFSPSLPAAVDVSSTQSVCYWLALGLCLWTVRVCCQIYIKQASWSSKTNSEHAACIFKISLK